LRWEVQDHAEVAVLVSCSSGRGAADLVSVGKDVQFTDAVRDRNSVKAVRTKGCPYGTYSGELHGGERLLGPLGESQHLIGGAEPHGAGIERSDGPARNLHRSFLT
jgi:hypothetical protein